MNECRKQHVLNTRNESGVHRDYMRKYLYGITSEQFAAMLESQNGRCAICKTSEPSGKGNWHVDHCHSSGKVRGLLCHFCNLMLGNAKDDVDRLTAAIEYINNHM